MNILIYLNKDWKDEYGGHLELWDSDMSHLIKKILPAFNTLVVFSTTDYSNHGHPDPLTCPDGESRKSLALYYYSNGRPAIELNNLDGASTGFKARAGHKEDVENQKFSIKQIMKKFIP